jgi:UDP:flavonoid glycosyltransferase YjiC (YdhE family)
MVVVPSVSGQEVMARIVARRGVGCALRPQGLSAARLRAVADRLLLDEAHRARASVYAHELAGTDAAAEAATHVVDIVRAGARVGR